MIKRELLEFLNERFETVIENKKEYDQNKIKDYLEINPLSLDDKMFITTSDIICKNNKNELFYFLYYGKKNTLMMYDNDKKCINIRMDNNVVKRYQYETLLKRIKKDISKSNSYLVIFSCSDVEFDPIAKKTHILITNQDNIDYWLSTKYDK